MLSHQWVDTTAKKIYLQGHIKERISTSSPGFFEKKLVKFGFKHACITETQSIFLA